MTAAIAPRRIQRRRTKGWRMPEGAVYVGRPSRWGNPFSIGEVPLAVGGPTDAQDLVDWYWAWAHKQAEDPSFLAPLRERSLVCWCPLDQPCHADVLLELANCVGVPA